VFDRLLKKRFYGGWMQLYSVLKASGDFDEWSVDKVIQLSNGKMLKYAT